MSEISDRLDRAGEEALEEAPSLGGFAVGSDPEIVQAAVDRLRDGWSATVATVEAARVALESLPRATRAQTCMRLLRWNNEQKVVEALVSSATRGDDAVAMLAAWVARLGGGRAEPSADDGSERDGCTIAAKECAFRGHPVYALGPDAGVLAATLAVLDELPGADASSEEQAHLALEALKRAHDAQAARDAESRAEGVASKELIDDDEALLALADSIGSTAEQAGARPARPPSLGSLAVIDEDGEVCAFTLHAAPSEASSKEDSGATPLIVLRRDEPWLVLLCDTIDLALGAIRGAIDLRFGPHSLVTTAQLRWVGGKAVAFDEGIDASLRQKLLVRGHQQATPEAAAASPRGLLQILAIDEDSGRREAAADPVTGVARSTLEVGQKS